MDIKTAARWILPTSTYDIGSGAYHLAKRDATPEQCSKLVAGAIRTSAATATFIGSMTAAYSFPSLAFPLYFASVTSLLILDNESWSLNYGGTGVGVGFIKTALGVAALAEGTLEDLPTFILDATKLGVAWVVTKSPREISFGMRQGILKDEIDNFSETLGRQIHSKTCLN